MQSVLNAHFVNFNRLKSFLIFIYRDYGDEKFLCILRPIILTIKKKCVILQA